MNRRTPEGSRGGGHSGWFPTPSRPRPVEGGLKARSTRGTIARTWWSERFIDVLESIVVGGRLQRGRTYARKGQVIEMTVDAGLVTAAVQGSRAEPYRIRIGLTPFDDDAWASVCQALAENAWYAAKLLAGEMPEDIEEVFTAVGLALFPADADDLSMDCTCPDWGVPCKHLAAVFYLLAESFDEDPFGILGWRGRGREELLRTLSELRSGGAPADSGAAAESATALEDCLGFFFEPTTAIQRRRPVHAPADAVLDQLPDLGVSARGVPLAEALRPAYLSLGGSTPDAPGGGPG